MASQHTSTVPPHHRARIVNVAPRYGNCHYPMVILLVYFTGAPEKLYLNVDFRSLCSTCFTQVEWKRVVLFGSRMTDCALTRLVCIMSFLPMRSHTMPRIAGKQTEHKRAILWLFTVQERCVRKRPSWNLSALLHRVAFVDVRTAIKDKCLRACVHIDATTQAMLMHRF